jgi:hypothetical protein
MLTDSSYQSIQVKILSGDIENAAKLISDHVISLINVQGAKAYVNGFIQFLLKQDPDKFIGSKFDVERQISIQAIALDTLYRFKN